MMLGLGLLGARSWRSLRQNRARIVQVALPGALVSFVLALPVARPLGAGGRILSGAAEASERPIPVIDLHVDLPYQVGYKGRTFAAGSGDFRAADLATGGLAGVVLPLFVPRQAQPGGRTVAEFEASYARVFGGILATPPYALPGCSVRRAGGEARTVETWLAFEGSEPLAADADALRPWVVRGVRLFGVVHAQHTDLSQSSGERDSGVGLTERGERFVRAVYEVGGLVDVSHASDSATAEVLEIARGLRRPVVATHSNARALAPHPRNLKDEHIRAIGESGGVIGVNFHQPFLDPGSGRITVQTVVDMIEHLARVGGQGVVAIGSDFEGGIRPAPGLENASRYQTLASALAEAGYSRAEVTAFFSGNARRVLCSSRR
jgi:membrane dipeptidase